VSSWEDEKDRRNRQALTRLTKSLPVIFPPAVLARARPTIYTADATAGDRLLLAGASHSR
jgi:hypothetical protein